jgi:hypothetical protein
MQNREEVLATLNKAVIQIKNGKDSTQARAAFVREIRKAGHHEFADRLEGKSKRR